MGDSRTATLTFRRWNKGRTRGLCEGLAAGTARNLRRARRGAQARLMLWEEYLAECGKLGVRAEPF